MIHILEQYDGTGEEGTEIRESTLNASQTIGDPSAARAVAELLDHKNAGARVNAAKTLWYLGSPQIVPKLGKALKDSVSVRWSASSIYCGTGRE